MRYVTIIGGGIAGLATAYYLQRVSRERGVPLHVVLLERDGRLGGKILTERANGFVVEGGPDSFINQKPQGLQLCRELGLGGELISSNDATYKTRLLQRGRLLPYPEGFRLAVPTKIWPFVRSPLLSPLGKLRMGMDLLLPRRTDPSDESLTHFICRRLGREALEKIAGPIMSGIYVADPDRMSVQSTFPMFVDLEKKYRSLTLGILKARRAAAKHAAPGAAPAGIFTALKNGMGSLIEALAHELQIEVRLNCEVAAVTREGERFRVAPRAAADPGFLTDELVMAAPAFEAARLLAGIEPDVAGLLGTVRYVSSATVSLCYPDAALAGCADGGGFGFVVPRSEPSRILAFTWSCRKFDHRAPPGWQLVRAFVGGSRHEPLASLPEDELLRLVREELASILHVTAAPDRSWIYRWPSGNAQFDVGHLDRVAGMERLAAAVPGLHLVGSAYRGVGIPDCARGGRAVAEAIVGRAQTPTAAAG